ncbi:rhombosortase [Alcanivorax sp. N3-2A]|nr:rhombosortase [Alcanivorax sp. N3-2A]|tara:strand:- start:15576 stop:16178 length:603 start_codon:yes stop_codon:yes gene_type:complete
MPLRDRKLRVHAALFITVLVALGLAHAWVNPWLRYDRGAVLDGQVWRLITAHLVHLNGWHLLLNLSGLLLILYFFQDLLDRRRFWLWFAFCALAVSLTFVFLDTGLRWYLGLSGLLQGLLVLCLVLGWRGNPWLHSLVLALVAGRLIWEQLPGYDTGYLGAWINAPVYVNAHLYGALSGLLLATVMLAAGPERRHARQGH